jgi:hypothetical protein
VSGWLGRITRRLLRPLTDHLRWRRKSRELRHRDPFLYK